MGDDDMTTLAKKDAVNLVIFYEAVESGFAAKEACDQICLRLPKGAGTRVSLWRFDSLSDRRTKHTAHSDMVGADVVMVAADGQRPLPLEFQQILEQCLSCRGGQIALAVLLHGVAEHEKLDSPVHSFFERFAGENRIDFFCQATGSQPDYDAEHFWLSAAPQTGSSPLASDLLESAVPGRGWGLNE